MRSSAPAPRRRTNFKLTELSIGRKHRPDYWLLIWCASLLSIGLIVVYAISPALSEAHHTSSNYYVGKQMVAIALSIVAFIFTTQVPLQWWRHAYKPLLVIAGLATLMALVLPVNPAYPAHRWVRLGGLSFQSVELVKFAVMVWFAGFLAERIKHGNLASTQESVKPMLIAIGVIAVVVAGIQSDLGSTGVMIAMMGTMVFVAGLPLDRIMMVLAVVSVGVILMVIVAPYRIARLQTFLHPAANCQDEGYQACQALIAVGSGGLVGLGLGSSVQAYGYLPEAANDSIFAIYAEKFGFIGTTVLLGVFIAFFTRLKIIAERLSDDFSRILVMGILAWLSVQAVINIGAMIGLLPLKGITLPFISYGGTSVVFAAAAVGLAFQASQHTSFTSPRITPDDRSGSRRDVVGATPRRANY